MTRRIIYGISCWAFLASAACTVACVALPNWITYNSPTDHDPVHITYGLHKRCSSITGECQPFPQYEDCRGEDKYFCRIWRSTGFLLNFSLMFELACIVAYVTILVGGRRVRESGWQILAGLLGFVALGEIIATALVAYLYEHDSRFFIGWELDKSWVLCTVSWAIMVIDALGVVAAAKFSPKEDDYEMIPEPR